MKANVTSKKMSSEYYNILSSLLSVETNPKLGLERMQELIKAISVDRSSFRVVQVVGTNGKGSTVAFIESILTECGISTGLFTSPHLSTVRERIRINKEMVDEALFCEAARFVLPHVKSTKASFFECMLAMALHVFQIKRVQVVILEAGLGGRLDATTALLPDILGVSMIDLDHQHILGETIKDIAKEKIQAARMHQTVVAVDQVADAEEVIRHAQKDIEFNLLKAIPSSKPLGLFGKHQKMNAGLALALIKELAIFPSQEQEERGLLTVNWPGRFEVFDGDAPRVLDGAHNPSGVLSLIDSLKSHPHFFKRPIILVYGSLKGPNAQKKVELLVHSGLDIRKVILHQPKNPRAMLISEIKDLFKNEGVLEKNLLLFESWEKIKQEAKKKGMSIVVCGSLYTVGEIRAEELAIEIDPKMPDF